MSRSRGFRGPVRLRLWARDALSACRWIAARRRPPADQPGVRILVYHAIADIAASHDPWRMSVPPALFAAQMAWLRQHGCTVVSLEEALGMVRGSHPMAAKAVAVTFDDGFADLWERAYPVLRDQGVPATVFAVPGYLGAQEPFPWLDRRAPFQRPLSWRELQALARDPLISVGSHTWSHRRLSELTREEQHREIQRSKSALEAGLGQPIKHFAYPYGHRGSFSDETVGCLERLGFEAAFANIMGTNRVGDSLWALRRTRIGWEDGLRRFAWKMAGAYDWIDPSTRAPARSR